MNLQNSAPNSSKSVELHLLGTFRISIGNRSITQFEAHTSRALLAYLVTHPEPQPREFLAQLLWANQENGLVNLRAALTRLRESIGDKDSENSLILAERQTIQINPSRLPWMDVREFEKELELVKKHRHRRVESCPICISRLTTISRLIQGEFLLDIYVNSLPFEEWLLSQREHYRRLSVQIFAVLTSYHLKWGNYTEAEQYARRQLGLEPWRESAHQQLIRALFESGQRTAALAQFKTCQTILEKEFGVQPTEQTLALYKEVRDAPFQKTTGTLNFSQTGSLAQIQKTRFPNNLPPSDTPFYGREAEIHHLVNLLVDPANRLVTLTGTGGVGKTRLALAAAKKLLSAYQHGVWFVTLADISDAQNVNEIRNAILLQTAFNLGISLDPDREMYNQLTAHFRKREMLLVVDNLEHILDGKHLIATWLESAPQLSVLITSREPLGFQSERVVQLQGLPIPASVNLQKALTTPAIQLFLDRVQRAQKRFALTAQNLPELVEICQFVQGHPLAIELLTAWIPQLSLGQILAMLKQNLGALHGPDDIPERHRNMDAVFSTSWKLLNPTQQFVLACLSIFQGGFSHVAVEAILDVPLEQLDTFCRKSLIQVAEDGRYSLHELLRQFASEKLTELGTERLNAIRQEFCTFYLGMIQQAEPDLFGPTPYLATPKIQNDWGNIYQAWQWAVDQRMGELLASSIDGLSRYYTLTGLGLQADLTFGYSVKNFAWDGLENEIFSGLKVRLLIKQAYYFSIRRNLRTAWEWVSQAAEIAQELAIPNLLGESYYELGHILHLEGFQQQATEYYQLALERARECQHSRLEIRCLIKLDFALAKTTAYNLLALEKAQAMNDAFFIYEARHQLGVSATFQGQYAIARRQFETLLQNIDWLPTTHPARLRLWSDLGEASRQLGDYPQALEYYNQALEIIRHRGDRVTEISVLDGLARLYRCVGNFAEAQQAAELGLALSEEISNLAGRFIHYNNLGNVFVKIQAWETAHRAYEQALEMGLEIGNEAGCMETYAGLAEAAYFLDDTDAARVHIKRVLDFMHHRPLDNSNEPLHIYLKCIRVLDCLEDPRGQEILESAYVLLQAQASAIDDPGWLNSFLTEEATNKAILEYWEMRNRLAMGLIGS